MDIYFDQFATDSRAGAISLTQPPPELAQHAVRAVTQSLSTHVLLENHEILKLLFLSSNG